MASDLESFTEYPLQLDPATKAISLATTAGLSPAQIEDLNNELKSLNSLHRSLISLDPPNVPPPPLPINPKRSAQITKLRDTANTAFRKSNFAEAIKLYGYAIEMALGRPPWEPLQLVRDELSGLYANRAQAYMSQQAWPEGWVDAKSSVECKPVGNAKGWWRGGKCLVEMGRWDEARAWIEQALGIEGRAGEGGKELLTLMEEIQQGSQRGS
jgi:translocation protein SEC72